MTEDIFWPRFKNYFDFIYTEEKVEFSEGSLFIVMAYRLCNNKLVGMCLLWWNVELLALGLHAKF